MTDEAKMKTIKELLDSGKQKGQLTQEELNNSLAEVELDAEQYEKVLDTLDEMGIDLIGEIIEVDQDDLAVDLAAEDLHEALYLLGRITGDSVDEQLLDDIFSRFCVGK